MCIAERRSGSLHGRWTARASSAPMGRPQVFSIRAVAWSSAVASGMAELPSSGDAGSVRGGSQRLCRGADGPNGGLALTECAGLLDRIGAEAGVRLRAAIARRSAAVCGAHAARWTAWVTAVRRTSSGVGVRETGASATGATGVSVTRCSTLRWIWSRSRITGAELAMVAAVAAIR